MKRLGSFLLFLALIPSGCNLASSQKITLTYWGMIEPEEAMRSLIEEYQNLHPSVTINYETRRYTTLVEYKETLFTRLREGNGPDIARIHGSWVGLFAPELAPLPDSVMDKNEFTRVFYPVALSTLVFHDKIYALPLEYDGLLLYYNPEHLQKIGLTRPPSDWEEFREAAVKLTRKDPSGRIIQSGAALGTAGKVAHFSDILGLLWAQSGVSLPGGLNSSAAADALTFYTNFAQKDGVWDASFSDSLQAFAEGSTSMIFAPARRYFEIQNLNPNLKFKVAAPPQIPSSPGSPGRAVNWGSFWAEAVSADAKNKEEAWKFLKFLAEPANMRRLYAEEAKSRDFGEPFSRVDLKSHLATHDVLAPLLDGASSAVSYPITDFAGNKAAVEAMGAAVESVLRGDSPSAALLILRQALGKILPQ